MYRILILFAAFVWSTHCFSVNYKIKDIGLIGLDESCPVAINDRGDVVGYIEKDEKREFFLWTEEKGLIIIRSIPSDASVNAINNEGQIVGSFWSLDGWWDLEWVVHTFTWSQKNGFKDLGTAVSKNTCALNIDEEGNVFAISSDKQCYLWKKENFFFNKFNKIPEASNILTDFYLHTNNFIFNKTSNTKNFNILIDVCWDNNNVIFNKVWQMAFIKMSLKDKKNPLNYLLLDYSTNESRPFVNTIIGTPQIMAMNNLGDIVGATVEEGKEFGYIVQHDEMVINNYHENFVPYGINDARIVVGKKIVQSLHLDHIGTILKSGELIEMKDLLLPNEEQPINCRNIGSLTGINNQGTIIGLVTVFGKENAVIFEPVNDD